MRAIYYALLFATLISTGCAPTAVIRTDWDKQADFSQYKTYKFAKIVDTNRGQEYDTLLTKYLKASVGRELEARGYTMAEADADLEVNFHIYTQQKIEVTSTNTPGGYGYYGYRRGYYNTWGAYSYDTVDEYTEGTLNLDIIDTNKQQLIFEGIAVGEVKKDAMDNAEAKLDAIVIRIFEKFPFTAGKGL